MSVYDTQGKKSIESFEQKATHLGLLDGDLPLPFRTYKMAHSPALKFKTGLLGIGKRVVGES
jgi:hypothetical protein